MARQRGTTKNSAYNQATTIADWTKQTTEALVAHYLYILQQPDSEWRMLVWQLHGSVQMRRKQLLIQTSKMSNNTRIKRPLSTTIEGRGTN